MITAHQTATLTISMTNRGERWNRTTFAYYKGRSSPNGILIYSPRAPDRPGGERLACVERPASTADVVQFSGEHPPIQDLAPEESWTHTLFVAHDPTVDGCFPEGEYRFETDHDLAKADFTWGFTLRVTS